MLTSKVYEVLGLSQKNATIGVEIEMEGRPRWDASESHVWRSEHDGSLRGAGAREYVLRSPKSVDAAKAAVVDLYQNIVLVDGYVNDSMRAGVHIHLNCQRMTVQKVFTLMAVYYCFENVFTDWFGPDRVGNLFCLRLKDAEYVNVAIESALQRETLFAFDNEAIRYAALNLCALVKYGSIEFRAMQTPTSPEPIVEWIDTIAQLKTASEKFNSPAEVLEFFSADGLENAIDVLMDTTIAAKVRAVPDYELKILEGIRQIQTWVFMTNWEKPDA